MNYQHWLSLAAARFTHSDSPKRDAEILLSFVTGKARTYLLAFGETEITQNNYCGSKHWRTVGSKVNPLLIWLGSASSGLYR